MTHDHALTQATAGGILTFFGACLAETRGLDLATATAFLTGAAMFLHALGATLDRVRLILQEWRAAKAVEAASSGPDESSSESGAETPKI